jgi:adenylyltransferase/sulfurtransferase
MHQPFKTNFIRYSLAIAVIFGIIGTLNLITVISPHPIPTFISRLSTPQITATELAQGTLNPIILIDVRSPAEYAQDAIADSQLVPITEIQAGSGIDHIQAIAQSASQLHHSQPTLVLYCKTDPRSIRAYHALKKTGLNFAVLAGGITAWREVVPK